MKKQTPGRILIFVAAAAAVFGFATAPAQAGTVSASGTPPMITPDDAANYGEVTGTEKWWAENSAAGSAKGQTFRTGPGAVLLRAITYQISSSQKAEPTKTYIIRVGTVSDTIFTPVYSETFTQSFTWNGGEYMTWTFTTPPLLNGDTIYGVDVGLTGSTSTWPTGIPYINVTANEFTGGQLYNSGTSGVGTTALTLSVNSDRIFHLDLEAPSGFPMAFVAGNPPDDAINALVPSELIATFNQPLTRGAGNVTIRNLSNSTETNIPATDARIALSANLLKIATPGLIGWNQSYAIRIAPGALIGTGGIPFTGITDDTTWNFTTATGDPLLVAISAIKNHILGFTNLTTEQLAAHSLTLDTESSRFAENASTISAVFDLIRTYDQVKGPLWVATGNLTRSAEAYDLTWTIYRAMQAIMDQVYNSQTLSQHQALLNGFKFNSSSNFPGPCPAPPPNQVYAVSINASFPRSFGRSTQGWDLPARKATGAYLAPGTLATVAVPSSLVGKGYKIRVGAHSWDMSNRPLVRRLDRCTLLYSINTTTTTVANPLGGGIYIEVPPGANAGVVNLTITGAARSPFFSATSFHRTTSPEWINTERTNPGPWADFQSDKFMMQVPRTWIYAYANPAAVMTNWDAAMDACNDLMGFPHDRGKETMYYQVDLLLRASVYAPGYPTVNLAYTPTTDYGGNANNYLLTGPQNVPDYVFHEQGHSYFFPKFPGESEANVNLLHVAVQHRKFGSTLNNAFLTSINYGNFRNISHAPLDNTAVLWMTSFNFSPRETAMADWEKAYQPQGHAKFVDLAGLFGWEPLDAFWYYYNSNATYVVSYPGDADSLLLQLCKSAGKDIRPLFHFWGIIPVNATALSNSVTAAGLQAPVEIYDRLVHYQSLVPTNNAAYQAWCLMWYGKQPTMSGYGVEREHARQWSTNLLNGTDTQVRFPTEIFDEAASAQVKARAQEIIDLYYPNGRPTDYATWAAGFPGANLANPGADLDGDGVSNDSERIWGLNPTNPLSRNAFHSVAGLFSGTFQYTRRTPALTGLNYTVWTSTNLTTWAQDAGVSQTPAAPAGNVETMTVTLSPAPLASPRLFVRLRAEPN